MKEEKSRLRELFKMKRASLTSAEILQCSFEILNQFKIWCSTRQEFNHFHLFLPIDSQNEINTFLIKEYLEAQQKKIYTSIIRPKRLEMDTFLLSTESIFEVSKMGIPNPVNAEEVNPDLIEVVLIPLLVVDKSGNRIGYGKGYYDIFLKKLHPHVFKVGLSCFPPEEKIPSEAHDVPLNFCITPKKIYKF